MILVPVKNLTEAKQRLASLLDAAERSALAAAMLEDVLETLATWPQCPPVAVITGDFRASRLACRFSFEVIRDDANGGETDAIGMATRVCESNGVTSTLVLPGDIPLLQARELEEIYVAAPPEGAVLVPASDGWGTNAALRRPAALFPLRFGNDSFLPHVSAARATGKPCVILRLPGIGLDVDTPADLWRLLAQAGQTRAQQLLRAWGVTERLALVSER